MHGMANNCISKEEKLLVKKVEANMSKGKCITLRRLGTSKDTITCISVFKFLPL